MRITLAKYQDQPKIARLDRHIPQHRLAACIEGGQVYVLKGDPTEHGGAGNGEQDRVLGILRYSLFWQTIPFVDLLYMDEAYRNRGLGTQMMREWEAEMAKRGYPYVMTSTQADEDAWKFYEKLGYRKVGGFFPPEQEAEEWMYIKEIGK